MNNLSKVQGMSNGYTTKEGGKAYKNTLKENITELFTLGLLNGTFYTKQEDVIKNAGELFVQALSQEPEFTTKASIYGSTTANLKLVPTIWMVYLSTLDDKKLFYSAFPKVIRNFNMLHNFMEFCRKGGIRKGLGRAVKQAINLRFIELINEYHATRSKGMLEEIARATRPLCQDEDFQKLMKYVRYGHITFPRAEALKTVIDGLHNGVYTDEMDALVRKHKIQLEEVKHSVKELSKEDKAMLYGTVYESLSYTALMLNLVSLERVFATDTRNESVYSPSQRAYINQAKVVNTEIPLAILDKVCDKISDINAYKKSKMLPFTLINAEKKVVTPEFKKAIAKLLEKVVSDVFEIPEEKRILIGVDTSGSMDSEVIPGLKCVEVASLFGAMLYKSHKNSNVYAIATDCKPVELTESMDVFKTSNEIQRTKVGYGTYFEQLLRHYNNQDYVILITDSEPADNLESRWLKQKKDGAKLIIWQVQSSGHVISRDASVTYVRGYSDSLISLIRNILENKGNQIESIEAIEI